MPNPEEPTIKYLVSAQRGEFVIEIPRSWRVTFGAVNPGGPVGGHNLHCLRVWEKKDQLRAVFCDVRGVRDLSIALARKVERETGSAEWTMDSEGNFERQARRQIEHRLEGDAALFETNGDGEAF